MTVWERCGGAEAELPAAYSFGDSGQHGIQRPQGAIWLKAFCTSNEVVEWNATWMFSGEYACVDGGIWRRSYRIAPSVFHN